MSGNDGLLSTDVVLSIKEVLWVVIINWPEISLKMDLIKDLDNKSCIPESNTPIITVEPSIDASKKGNNLKSAWVPVDSRSKLILRIVPQIFFLT